MTSDRRELEAKLAEIVASFADVPHGSAEHAWDFEQYAVPDDQEILRIMRGEGLPPAPPLRGFSLS